MTRRWLSRRMNPWYSLFTESRAAAESGNTTEGVGLH